MNSNTDIDMYLNDIYKRIKNEKERDYFNIHRIRYKLILESISTIGLASRAAVLDIGVYPPHLFTALSNLGFDVHGIASNHEEVSGETIDVLNIETDKLPYKNGTFQLVLMSEVIEHLTSDPTFYLSEIKRVLVPGGYLLITTPNAAHLKNRAKLLLGQSASFPLEQLYGTKPAGGTIYYRHNRELTMDELRSILAQAGFTIAANTYKSVYTPFRPGVRRPLVSRISGYIMTLVVPSLRDTLFVLAKNRS